MKKKNITYKNGDPVCEYRDDWQVIYNGNCREEHRMVDGFFTGEVVFYENDEPYAYKEVISYDKENKTVEGRYYVLDEDSGHFVEDRKFVIDYKTYIETIYNTPEGGAISEISYLSRSDCSTRKTFAYYTSGHLSCIENKKNNLPHGTVLYFYNSNLVVPQGTVSNVKRHLAVYEKYKNGIMLTRSEFDTEGGVTRRIVADDFSRNSYYTEEYRYDIKEGSDCAQQYRVTCYNPEYMYEDRKVEGGIVIERSIYDQHQEVLFELHTPRIMFARYDEQAKLVIYEDTKSSHPKYSKTKDAKFIPSKWDENGDIISGNKKYYEDGILISNGPFKVDGENFIVDGTHLSRRNVAIIYQNGKAVKEYPQNVMEVNGELIVQQNNLSLEQSAPQEQPKP